jgi:butyryl-CoA dehydrogenase
LAGDAFDPPGGAFLLSEEGPAELLTPEKLSPDAQLLASATADFMRGAVLPAAERLQSQEPGLMRSLLTQAGELGLMGLEIPEKFGGLGLQKSVATRIAEAAAVEPSFAVSLNVHTSVATFPLLFFGSAETKEGYLSKLASGEWIAAYALSEAHAGSDAMAARTRAVPVPGGYKLTGEKMWITNASFADLFTVFARMEGQDGLTAFLVERSRPGLTIGREEHKVGLKGSSTCRVLLDGVEILAANRLGDEGAGGKVALNTLNLGRFKIAASSLGRSKDLLGIAARYAVERKAFGQPIAEFGLVAQKLARICARIFAAESMLYRLAGCLDRAFDPIDHDGDDLGGAFMAAAEEYAAECAMVKVFCTETLDFCADECMQIHGGYGYTEEYAAGRAWRDARVNRIYEGTSEINRFNVAHLLARRARSGRIDLTKAETDEAHALALLLQAEERQERLGAMADLAAELYARQSIEIRRGGMSGVRANRAGEASAVFLFDSETRSSAAFRLLESVAPVNAGARGSRRADEPTAHVDVVEAGRSLSRAITEAGGYLFA